MDRRAGAAADQASHRGLPVVDRVLGTDPNSNALLGLALSSAKDGTLRTGDEGLTGIAGTA